MKFFIILVSLMFATRLMSQEIKVNTTPFQKVRGKEEKKSLKKLLH